MITAEQAWENAKPIILRKEEEEKVKLQEELKEWLERIAEASRAGETHITVDGMSPWQTEELKRLRFRVTFFNYKHYIVWADYSYSEPKPKKSLWAKVHDFYLQHF